MNALSKFREDRGLTQEQIAELLGTTKATVSRWESDKRRPDPAMVVHIESKLGIPRQELRPDLYQVGLTPPEPPQADWGRFFGFMKGQITFAESFDPTQTPYSEEEWNEIEKEWLASWDEQMKSRP